MKRLFNQDVMALGVHAVLLLCLLGLLFLADREAESILMFSLRYPGTDKLAHFFMHLGLLIWLYGVIRFLVSGWSIARLLLVCFGLSLTLGVLDEMHQLLINARSFDPFDIMANICGASSAVILLAARKQGRRRYLSLLLIPVLAMYVLVAHDQGSRLYYNAGLMYIKNRNYSAAHQAFMFAIDRGEHSAALFNELAWLELEHLEIDPAGSLEYTRRAVAAQPDNADFLDTHGWALFMNGRYNEALDYLYASYDADHQGYCINYHLGATYYALNMPKLAGSYLRAQLALNPEDRFAHKARKLLKSMNQSG